MEKIFNQKEYNAKYAKEHYKQFKAKIKTEEMDEINELLKEKNMNKTEFIKFGKWALKGNDIYEKYQKEKL